MRVAIGKFGFIHRRLWQRDGLYRAALLFGPAALTGIIVVFALREAALSLFLALPGAANPSAPPPPWAVPQSRPDLWPQDASEPLPVQAARPLPPITAAGALSGYIPGWRATLHQIVVKPALNVDLERDPLVGFVLDGSTIDMTRLIAEGPKGPPFAGTGAGFLAIKTAGVYALSARFDRSAGRVANCIVRLGFGGKRVVSVEEIGIANDVSKTYDPIRFNLQPGLYNIAWAFGCWHDAEMSPSGRMTVLVGHPDAHLQLSTARPDEIVRVKPAPP
jgi:hypothetical protein